MARKPGRPKRIFIHSAFWHRFCIDTEKIPDSDAFDNRGSGWRTVAKVGDFDFRLIECHGIKIYSLIVERHHIDRPYKPISDLFREHFGTTPIVNWGFKKIFIWTRSSLWLDSEELKIDPRQCKFNSCRTFIRELETLFLRQVEERSAKDRQRYQMEAFIGPQKT